MHSRWPRTLASHPLQLIHESHRPERLCLNCQIPYPLFYDLIFYLHFILTWLPFHIPSNNKTHFLSDNLYQVICEKSSFNKKHSIAKTVASIGSKQIIILAGSALRVALLCVVSPGFSLFKSSTAVQPLCRHNEAWGALQWWGAAWEGPTLFPGHLCCDWCIMECALRQGGNFSENNFYLCCKVCIIIHCTAG